MKEKLWAFVRAAWADPAQRARIVKSVVCLAMFALGFWVGRASAADASLTWINPTTRTDGSALVTADLRGTRIEYGSCSGAAFGTKAGEIVASAGATAATIPGLANGVPHCFRAYARATDGTPSGFVESVATNVVSKTFTLAPPNSPGGFALAGGTAFTLIRSQDRLVMLPVGTMTGDTACSPDYAVFVSGVMYSAVPTTAITYSGSVRPVVTFARCTT